jgi:chromosomal replication initiation ATPase DnaA
MDQINIYAVVAFQTNTTALERLKTLIILAGNTIYPMKWEDLESANRKRELVLMRQFFCYLCDRWKILPTPAQISQQINKERTTAIHSIQKIEDLLDSKDDLALHIHNFILNHKNR